MRKLNLVGQRFGRLVVLEECKGNDERVTWLCRCDCGKTSKASTTNLRTGNTISCGCYYREVMKDLNAKRTKGNGYAALTSLLVTYKKSAKKRSLVFLLSRDDFEYLTKQKCFYCGEEPTRVWKGCDTYNGTYTYNGIDRIDSDKGYTLDNVVSCCMRCNQAKNDMKIEDFFSWVSKIYNSFVVSKRIEIDHEN